MFSITYEAWKSVCDMYFSQKTGLLKAYLQWFPFSKLSKNDKEKISSQEYFEKYIQSGAYVLFIQSMLRTDNYLQKGDGSFRTSTLISPILYLLLQSIGKTISDAYYPQRPEDISVYYGGNLEQMRCHYKQDYDTFYKQLNSELDQYHYFIKTDIREFYGNINLNILVRRIDEIANAGRTQITQNQLQLYKEVLYYCGNGGFPTIENSVALSYLATMIYLDEVDIALHKFIADKITAFVNFKMVRYADDLYILIAFNKPIGYLHKAYNEIRNEYSSILKEFGLSLNATKCCLKPVSEINNELKKSLYAEYVNGQKCEIADLCPDGIKNFIKNLSTALFIDFITVEEYNEIIKKSFFVPDIEFTASEIFNYFIYENDEVLRTDEVVMGITALVKQDVSFISLDPKRLTLMIMKSGNDKAIKTFLNQLFSHHRAGKWNSYDTTIAIAYLIQGRFRHIDLLDIIRVNCPELFDYYNYFCRVSFGSSLLNKSKNKIIEIIAGDTKTYYLYFMYWIELSKNNVMAAYAYFKNYFDRLSAQLAFATKYDNNGKKPNYNRFYRDNELKRLYSGIKDSDAIIKKSHELRNANPLAHAGAELIDNNSSSKELLLTIESIKKLVVKYCRENGLL